MEGDANILLKDDDLFPVGSVRLTDSAAPPDIGTTSWQSVETGIAGVYGWRRVT